MVGGEDSVVEEGVGSEVVEVVVGGVVLEGGMVVEGGMEGIKVWCIGDEEREGRALLHVSSLERTLIFSNSIMYLYDLLARRFSLGLTLIHKRMNETTN